jgi:predicted nucleic-acid-binding Zn-ribbon protein
LHYRKCYGDKGQSDLRIGETSPYEFMAVENLRMNCDTLLGQEWLERFGYQFQIPDTSINLPAYSENSVRIPTTEKGSQLVEAQDLQENIFLCIKCVECVYSSFTCLVINCHVTTLQTHEKGVRGERRHKNKTTADKTGDRTSAITVITQKRGNNTIYAAS